MEELFPSWLVTWITVCNTLAIFLWLLVVVFSRQIDDILDDIIQYHTARAAVRREERDR